MKRNYLRGGVWPHRPASPEEVAFAQRCLSLDRHFGPEATPLARQGMVTLEPPRWCALLQPGDTVNYSYFVQRGTLLGHAPADEAGRCAVRGIYREGSVVLPTGLFERGPGPDVVVTAEAATVVCLHYAEWTTLMQELPGFNLAVHNLREAYQAAREAEWEYLQGRDVKGRMLHLLRRWPDAFAVLPNWVIASYLGISADAVSHNKRAVLRLNRSRGID